MFNRCRCAVNIFSAVVVLALPLVWAAPVRAATVNLQLRPAKQVVCSIGSFVDISLYAISKPAAGDPSNTPMAALSVILNWDKTHLSLLGILDNSPYNWLATFFTDDRGRDRLNADRDIDQFWSEQVCTIDTQCANPPGCQLDLPCDGDGDCRPGVACDLDATSCTPFDGCCEISFCGFSGFPFNDGDCLYEAWSQLFSNPAEATQGSGLLITTFRFAVLSVGSSSVSIVPFAGLQTLTKVFGTEAGDVNILGTILGPPATINSGTIEAPASVAVGCRYIQVTPGGGTTPIALRVDGNDEGTACIAAQYVQAPDESTNSANLDLTPVFLTPAEWGTVYIRDSLIVPNSSYTIRADCGGGAASSPVTVNTPIFADVNFTGNVDLDDLLILLAGFAGDFTFASFEAQNLLPCSEVPPELETIDLDEILGVLAGFAGLDYEEVGCPAPCP